MRRVGLMLSVMAALLVVTAGVALAASVLGTKQGDNLNGTSEKDVVVGAQGGDTIDGRSEADQLYGDSGGDTLKGGQGDDYLEGGRGLDTLKGEAGNDYLNAVDGIGANDKADGGDGTEDTCVIDAGDSVFVNKTDGTSGFEAIADQAAADAAEANSTCETIYVVPVPAPTAAAMAAGAS